MTDNSLNSKILNATKWASLTEFIAKLITPVTSMILARILAPDAFGVIATITMIVSFADMFTDAGFQKYLIQHEFRSDKEKDEYANVAFWTNMMISITLWITISIFSDEIAKLVGSAGKGYLISVSCIQLPLTSFSSIQLAMFRREFNYKSLFWIRIIGVFIPLLVTIPLALAGLDYWSLIIGNIAGAVYNAIILTIRSNWKPSTHYKFDQLRLMISFSIWSLVESISIWLTNWIDSFIIGATLSSYYLGIYKTSLTTVNTIFGLIIGVTTPILFSGLSRLQKNTTEFNGLFFTMQKMVSYLIFPLSFGIFVFSDIAVKILLGENWNDASYVMGVWALVSGVVIVLGNYSSEVYRAKGLPKLSFIAQISHLIFLVPTCIIASKFDFLTLVNARAIVRIQSVIVNLLIMKYIAGISITKQFSNISVPVLGSVIMGFTGIILRSLHSSLVWNIISILICLIVYVSILLLFKNSRSDIINIFEKILPNKYLRLFQKA